MTYKLKVNQGSIFRNERKLSDTSPDFSGTVNVAGIEYRISLWNNPPVNDKKGFFNVRLTQKDELPSTGGN